RDARADRRAPALQGRARRLRRRRRDGARRGWRRAHRVRGDRARQGLPFQRRAANAEEVIPVEVDLNRIIDQVVKDKNIKREVVTDTLERAMLTAARRKYGPEREIEAQFNNETGEVELFEFKTVVAGAPANDAQISLDDAHRHDPDAEADDQ